MKRYLFISVFMLLAIGLSAQNFTTEGNGIRNVVTGHVKGKPVMYISELDGTLSSYNVNGKKLWSQFTPSAAVLFEIEAADINGDGNDDVLAASGDGHIYCYSSKGVLLWKYAPEYKVRFSEIAIIDDGENAKVFAGGNDQKLYELDNKGNLLSSTDVDGLIRKIEAGNFVDKNKPSLFIMTYQHDKYRWKFFGIIDPDTKKEIRSASFKKKSLKKLGKQMLTDISVADITKDGKDELLLFGTTDVAEFMALNGDLEPVAQFTALKKAKQRYAHTVGTCLLPVRDEIAMQYGGLLYSLNLKGELIGQSGDRYQNVIYNDLTLLPDSKQLIGGGQVGGGNSLYFYTLKNSWYKKIQKLQGRMAEVNDNINTLYKQVLNFEMPAYQTKSDKPWIMITSATSSKEVMKLNGADIIYAPQVRMQENWDRSELVALIGESALKKDKRMQYDKTQDEIVALAKELEAKGQAFTAWTGHGNDPFITSLETMLKVLEVAPNTCYGFIYAEMDNVNDPRVQHFINHYVPALAKAMRKNGKAKMYFRYKNVFWGGTSHLEPWKSMFFGGEYADVLVPASEDTSSRTQDVNLAGRVGMWAGGYINDFAMRLVDDNPTSWRPLTPGGQRSVSPYLRQGVMMAAYGARYGILFSNKYMEDPGYDVLYALMKSGVLPIAKKENIESISSWHLLKDVDAELNHDINHHHTVDNFTNDDADAVFSLTQMRWAGTDVPDYDYSRVLGVDYRWLNYIPILPKGMVPIGPFEYAQALEGEDIPYTVSDMKHGFLAGNKVAAKDFGLEINKAAIEGAKNMPLSVEGAAWSAIRIDEKHIRVILMDQGYIDPQAREAIITIQGENASGARDVLSGEELEIKNNKVVLTVPTGSLRFIDVSYK